MADDPKDTPKTPQAPERYPSVRQDDAVERTGRAEQVSGPTPGEDRSFDPAADAPTPGDRDIAEGEAPPASNEGKLGAGGDPAEGKR
jgi:hypothetical protein